MTTGPRPTTGYAIGSPPMTSNVASDLALNANYGHGLESLMRMSVHATLLAVRRKRMRCGVVEQEKRTQLPTEAVVIERGAHRDYRCGSTDMNSADFTHDPDPRTSCPHPA